MADHEVVYCKWSTFNDREIGVEKMNFCSIDEQARQVSKIRDILFFPDNGPRNFFSLFSPAHPRSLMVAPKQTVDTQTRCSRPHE